MADEDAFQQGYDAYWDGVGCDDNPFISETDQHYSRDEGWSQAELEDDEPDGGWNVEAAGPGLTFSS